MIVNRFSFLFSSLVLLSIFASCDNSKDKLFQKLDIAEAGINFKNTVTPTEDFNIIDYLYFYNGGGVAIGDINGDQLPDVFFSGNQVKNKLFLNKGNLNFEDISQSAGVEGESTWNTGSVMADVNGDGLLDIYVCAVVGLKNLSGHNELYINNGNNTFTESAAQYGLDFESYSSSASFFDYDLDGDLDMYLLNHAIHTPGSFGHANLRNIRTYETGDKLLRNDSGKFTDVSESAGIYGGINGYGLGLAISDFNVDGYPDIYIGNDFHEDDYLYINNGNGTFTEKGRDALTFTSKFSMGNDVSDINHDGLPDLISLDMLSDDETILKRSEGDEDIKLLRLRTGKYGYYYQFQRNMLQINQGNGTFSETALMSGVAATDWSWSALFTDFDQDGNQDLLISNGIPKRPNDLDYIKYVSSEQVVNMMGNTKLMDQKALSMMPSGKIQNMVFRGSGDYGFEDKTDEWLPQELTCSTATALSDLDNDGDLDVVINNVDDVPSVYINQINDKKNFLKITLHGPPSNKYGIGAKIYSFHNGIMQLKEMFTVRGFQSSSEPVIHFGYDNVKMVDSIKVIWPGGDLQVLKNLNTNQSIVIESKDSKPKNIQRSIDSSKFWFAKKDLGLQFIHVEDNYTDFDRLKLLPYQQSDHGPATAIGDLNNDGNNEIFFGGSKHIPGRIYTINSAGFVQVSVSDIIKDSVVESVEAIIEDLNNDQKSDIFIATGGADFYSKSTALLDFYYISNDTGFVKHVLPDYYENASCIVSIDFDSDGDKDIFVGSESVSNDFGKTPKSYLLKNQNGNLIPDQTNIFENLGMVTDAAATDFNNDGQLDLVISRIWAPPLFLKNVHGVFVEESLLADIKMGGLWQTVIPFDFDSDGKMDFLLGNWGLNSKFKASADNPLKMYYGDFDSNGQSETVVAIERNGSYYPLESLDILASQMPTLRKKFTSYSSFAGKTIEEIFTSSQLKNSTLFEVHQLNSGILKNNNGKFYFNALPLDFQIAPILTGLVFDFNSDGKTEVLVGGNYFGLQPFHGRLGAFGGAIIQNEEKYFKGKDIGLNLFNKSVRHFNIFEHKKEKYLLITVNNGKAEVYKLTK